MVRSDQDLTSVLAKSIKQFFTLNRPRWVDPSKQTSNKCLVQLENVRHCQIMTKIPCLLVV